MKEKEPEASKKNQSGKKQRKAKKKQVALFFTEKKRERLRLAEQVNRNASFMIAISLMTALLSLVMIGIFNPLTIKGPGTVLLLAAVLGFILALYSLHSNFSISINFNGETAEAEQLNLLYRGEFQRLSYLQYEDSILRKFENQALLNGNKLWDGYQQEVVIAKKYLILRFSNLALLIGLVLSSSIILYSIFTA